MQELEQSIREMEDELRKLAVKIWLDLSKPPMSPSRKRKTRTRKAGNRRPQNVETSHAA
jgi:hypothetical protein